MTKTEIAKNIADICRNDASFCKDIKGGDPELFLSKITDDMSEKDFMFSVIEYLASFKVWGHLYFYKKWERIFTGFRVRRYQNSLFITRAVKDLPFSKGDEIVAVDGMTIDRAAEKFAVFFDGDTPDRQGERWETLISNADAVTVRTKDKGAFDYQIRTDVVNGAGEPSCVCRFIEKDCFYVKLTNFFDGQDIQSITDCISRQSSCVKNLIIDLRNNCGGSDTEFLPFLKFLLTENDLMCGKPIFTAGDEILYSERNADGRIKYYKERLENCVSEEVRAYFNEQIEEQQKNKGKGFVTAKADEFLFPPRGTVNPQKVVILTDCYCASSAESLVDIASRLQKVTVIGRPTMGICDYSNLTRFDFGEYVLHYPTSRSKAIDIGKGTRGKGLEPDIYVPWTPKHIFEDVDLSVALDWLAKS